MEQAGDSRNELGRGRESERGRKRAVVEYLAQHEKLQAGSYSSVESVPHKANQTHHAAINSKSEYHKLITDFGSSIDIRVCVRLAGRHFCDGGWID